MRARDAMVTDVIAVRAETPVDEIVRLLTTHRIGSVPVVDGEGRVVGIVGETDLFLQERSLPLTRVTLPQLFGQPVNPESGQLDEAYARARGLTAGDVMTREVITVDAEDDLGQVAWLMAQQKLEHAPVLDGGRLAGSISRSDVLRVLATTGR